jgi:ethanolamine ammonia-lyase small subunit
VDRDDLRRLVTEEVLRTLREAKRNSGSVARGGEEVFARKEFRTLDERPVPRWLRGVGGTRAAHANLREEEEHAWGQRDLPPAHDEAEIRVDRPANPEALRRIVRASPMRLAVGRAGTRYLTDVYMEVRADHAVAKDAVEAELPDGFEAQLQALALRTRCTGKQDYLLHPDHGRQLDDASRALLEREGSRGVDVQLIVGDGLAPPAIVLNAPPVLEALVAELRAAGLSTGRLVAVRYARVGVQDEIGVALGAKATILLVGERPGLGTGDSMSAYIAYAPKPAQDNAEKNCVSNIRPGGISPSETARSCVAILKRAFASGKGGVAAS